MPAHQPVGFVCREDWVQPIEQQLNDCRLTKPFDAERQPCLEGVRFIVTKSQQLLWRGVSYEKAGMALIANTASG